jgi:hypothetical protein
MEENMKTKDNMPKWVKAATKFNNVVRNVISPSFLRPSSKDRDESKLKYGAKLALSGCWALAVSVTALSLAPGPTLAVAATNFLSRKAVEKYSYYSASKSSGNTSSQALYETFSSRARFLKLQKELRNTGVLNNTTNRSNTYQKSSTNGMHTR